MKIHNYQKLCCLLYANTVTLFICVHFVNIVAAENTIDIATTTVPDISPINKTNEYCKYFFGLPPIPVDPLLGNETTDYFEKWVPPTRVANHLHWILSGFSPDNLPIWIRQFTNILDFGEVLSNNTLKALYLQAERQMWYIMIKSQKIKSTQEKPVNHHILITDFEGFNQHSATTVTDPRVVTFFKSALAKGSRLVEKYVEKRIFINMNFLAELTVNAINIINRRTFSKFQVYGTSKAMWINQLQRQFRKDQLPERYGGFKGHKPIPIRQNEKCDLASR